MIKTVNSQGRYVMVNGGFPATTYINNSSGMGAGNVRWNTSTQCMEICDGYSWQQLSMSHASVGLTPDAENVIDWAKQKMLEERELLIAAETNPAINDLLKQKTDLEDKIKMVQTIMKQEVTVNE